MLGILASSFALGLIGINYMTGHGQGWYPPVVVLNLFLISVHAKRVIEEGK